MRLSIGAILKPDRERIISSSQVFNCHNVRGCQQMRTPRFFAAGADLRLLKQSGKEALDRQAVLELAEDDLIKQLRQVLRLGRGQRFILLDDEAVIYELVIESMEKSRVLCRLSTINRAQTEQGIHIEIGLALIKNERFEWAVEKLTELGAASIRPLQCQHSQVKIQTSLDEARGKNTGSKLRRWQAIAREAAEQCERLRVPELRAAETFNNYVSSRDGGPKDLRYICVERKKSAPLAKALAESIYDLNLSPQERIASIKILIGPEGGWSKLEIESAETLGWQPVSLGTLILRSETAAIVAMSQVASVLDI